MISCITNEPCSRGYCCESYIHSTSYQRCSYIPRDCYTGDGTRDEYQHCQNNTQCATDCCHDTWHYCWGTTVTSQCMTDGLPGWAIAIIVVMGLVVVGVIIICVCCCVYAARRRRQNKSGAKTKVSVIRTNNQPSDPRNLSQQPVFTTIVYPSAPQPAYSKVHPAQPQLPYIPQPQSGYIPHIEPSHELQPSYSALKQHMQFSPQHEPRPVSTQLHRGAQPVAMAGRGIANPVSD